MSLVIRLLGTPMIEADDRFAPMAPRGRKSWAVLAYVLLAERPPARRRLAELLFADADDPLGALRWSLAEIRRGLRPYGDLSGDPVTIRFDDGVRVVVDVLDPGGDDPDDEAAEPFDGELLAGMSFEGCEAFESWLMMQRRRLTTAVDGRLRERALRELGAGRPGGALAAAGQLVQRNPLDESGQELLILTLARLGERRLALEQLASCEQLFRRQLGVEPSPSLRRAAEVEPVTVPSSDRAGRAAARAQLESGHGAVSAGAVDTGLGLLRRAADQAQAAGDRALQVEALLELGGSLVHAARGRDEEGAVVLHQALSLVGTDGDPRAAARACRELGFVDVQAGRRDQAARWLTQAEQLAGDDAGELAAILGVHGMNLSDSARYGEALEVLDRSVEHARGAGARRQQAWSLSLIGRVHLLRGRLGPARSVLGETLDLVRAERWTAFSPWPQTLLADVDLAEQRHDVARDGYAQAYALGCQLGDPCWEGMAARGLALVEARTGSPGRALELLDDGRSRATRWPDPYQWVHAAVLDAACEVAVTIGDGRAPRLVGELETLAGRTGMPEFVVRSYLHAARLGRPGAVGAAALAVADIDNPVLAGLVGAAERRPGA